VYGIGRVGMDKFTRCCQGFFSDICYPFIDFRRRENKRVNNYRACYAYRKPDDEPQNSTQQIFDHIIAVLMFLLCRIRYQGLKLNYRKTE